MTVSELCFFEPHASEKQFSLILHTWKTDDQNENRVFPLLLFLWVIEFVTQLCVLLIGQAIHFYGRPYACLSLQRSLGGGGFWSRARCIFSMQQSCTVFGVAMNGIQMRVARFAIVAILLYVRVQAGGRG